MQLPSVILTLCVAAAVTVAVGQDCQEARRRPVPVVLPTPVPTPVWLPAMGLPPEAHVPGSGFTNLDGGRGVLKIGPVHWHPTPRGCRPCKVYHDRDFAVPMNKPLEAI